ncbi:MAG: ABC transporter permease [Faecalicoccus sp.]|nr:ABC transporter permease [Faecalicoccus sp.]
MTKRKMFFRMITASLIRRRSRMIIALLAIAMGAAILSGLITIYYDVPRQMSAQFRSYGSNMLILPKEESFTMEDLNEATELIAKEDIVGVVPYRYETVRINETAVMAAGIDMEQTQKTNPYWALDGQWPAQDGELMVGKEVAATYGLKVGSSVTVTYTPAAALQAQENGEVIPDNMITLKVTSILSTGGSEEKYIYMTIPDIETLTEINDSFDVAELSIKASGKKIQAYNDTINENASHVHSKLVKRVTQSETTVLSKLQALVLLVTIIVLALTMICVATTMTAVVTERRMEIGLRKALGASDSSIVHEFLGEGILLGGIGGILGSLLGFAFAQFVSMNVFNSSISFRPVLIPITLIVSIAVTALACILPIRGATKIDPVLVLKGE